jgi:hypothetical protein
MRCHPSKGIFQKTQMFVFKRPCDRDDDNDDVFPRMRSENENEMLQSETRNPAGVVS